jgi:hypothetical protein
MVMYYNINCKIHSGMYYMIFTFLYIVQSLGTVLGTNTAIEQTVNADHILEFKQLGEICNSDSQCQSRICTVNTALSEMGHPIIMGTCIHPRQLNDNRSLRSVHGGTAVFPASIQLSSIQGKRQFGESCNSDGQCLSGKCSVVAMTRTTIMGKCIELSLPQRKIVQTHGSGASFQVSTPVQEKKQIGQLCNSNAQCLSGKCTVNITASGIVQREIMGKCVEAILISILKIYH